MALIDSVKPAVQYQSYLAEGAVVATYSAPWGSKSDVKASHRVGYFTWPRDEAAPQPDAGIGDGACGGGPPGRPPEPQPRRAGHQRSPDHRPGDGEAWPSLATDPDQLADWPPPRRKPADSATATKLFHAGVSQFEAAKAESVTGGLAAH